VLLIVDIQEAEKEALDRIDLAEGRVRWPALVNALNVFSVPKNAGDFLTR